jgi:hypothetical protein
MPNWYLNSVGWIVSFLRYAAPSLFWALRDPGRHDVIKEYGGGLMALGAHHFPRAGRVPHVRTSVRGKKKSGRSPTVALVVATWKCRPRHLNGRSSWDL